MNEAAALLSEAVTTALAILVMTLGPLIGLAALAAGVVALCRHLRRTT